MTMFHLLRDLLAVDTDHPKKGICAQLPGYRQLQFQDKVFEAWPLFSGNLYYPVPHPDPDITPTDAYHQACFAGTMWVGPYGDNRRNLLEFWIEKTADAMILRSLLDLKINGPRHPQKGICWHFPLYNHLVYRRVCKLFTRWPQFSGERLFPVPPGVDAYYSASNLWDQNTPYGQARYDLLDFLIKELSDAQL